MQKGKAKSIALDRDLPLLVDYERARRELGNVSERHIHNLVQRGLLIRKKVGRRSTITRESLEQFAATK
ncbi:hypothetical protein [Bradyrhizobium iriomotense]|uniref:Helix-turn-helix domain-containing protein n=1 Tax=Bradyrhizobium iriomotense TaxID=441950 RepID=A0ABQ6AWB9_9BRAD|nr:hypothetical protein [Bradyrhizobium iriomotense]GLR85848.1 hypothetical protein GCM10007857_25590 [Bradyrhizobium iriomotense]